MIKFLQKGDKYFIKNNKLDKKYLNIKTKNKILVDFFDDYSVIFTFSAMKKYSNINIMQILNILHLMNKNVNLVSRRD